ncbi:thiamine-phosphate synthase family protein [Thermococcus waiotapuensis]|uniref:Thiamine-phosphate synthase family protein n=1 Tax=Thermococcus waiotapuensis TaxID=90909 RepID=A0AAE4NUR7_9EURY|nr:thiamine-phosphate synthase family protein [Thermococcus waiotapuensis]MDV3102975.1 thiamine-phosphate synthase family protein [Thermococcus waiotapuensis]
MRTPAVYLAEVIMPYLRAKIAEVLYRGNLRQAEIADYLGVTQTMVSKYLSGRYKKLPDELASRIDEIAEEAGRFILYGGTREGATVLVSRRLVELFQSGFLCRFYAEYAGISEEACHTIYSTSGKGEVLEKLSLALRRLISLQDFGGLIPEVRSNFAYSVQSPSGPEDVAAVPGRITLAKGKPYALPPEFGASRFTAGILVRVGKLRPEVRSVLNIRYGDDVERALKLFGFKLARVSTAGLEEREAMKKIASPFSSEMYDVVIDEGGHGVEPVVYIFGRDPFEVVDKVERLLQVLGGGGNEGLHEGASLLNEG